jgi:elongation factor G
MFVPEPVISLSIRPKHTKDTPNFSKAMSRFTREDPTFRVHTDAESQETIISGMGELHLDIYIERMRREYRVECETGQPQVAYRETMTQRVNFDHTFKKQSGGSGDFARVVGWMEPAEALGANKFEQQISGGTISEKFLFACEKGFMASTAKGPLLGHKVLGTNMIINDGATHAVDSSEMAFKMATQQAFRKAFNAGAPQVLEPLMKTTITAPNEFQGSVVALLNKRNSVINDTDIGPEDFTVYADCSLNSMFGFSSQLRASSAWSLVIIVLRRRSCRGSLLRSMRRSRRIGIIRLVQRSSGRRAMRRDGIPNDDDGVSGLHIDGRHWKVYVGCKILYIYVVYTRMKAE